MGLAPKYDFICVISQIPRESGIGTNKIISPPLFLDAGINLNFPIKLYT